tara:strand:+ start:302 stop:1351 length:1050 start_codon:yes stop_codon:yes gene_type:complete
MAYTTIDDPSAHFQIALWTGNGSTPTITNDGNSDLQPDWLWGKNRTGSADHNYLIDSTRGTNKYVFSNSPSAQITNAAISSLNSDGFTLTSDVGLNRNSSTYVGWQWKANGGSRTTFTESGNNPGGGYQANTTAGFSIVDYTGTGALGTIAHGLGVAPTVVWCKGLDDGHAWLVGHTSMSSNFETDLILSNSDAQVDETSSFNDTAPTSSVFTVNSSGSTNQNGEKFIAYCFAPIQGYSKFGSYKGNGNADGTFVYTGFSPAWVLVKRFDSGNNWHIHDSKRVPFNPNNKTLYANLTNTEGTENFDMLSNGFKLRETGGGYNASGGSYIYMAFAESPFVSSEGIPTTAR